MDKLEQKFNTFLSKNKKNILISIIFIFILFFLFLFFKTYFHNETYQMYFESSKLSDNNELLYIQEGIDSNKFGQFVIKDDEAFAEILGSPISIAFQPEYFPLNKNIRVSLVLNKDKIGDWEISLLCPNCDERHNWQPFYYGFLLDYKKIFHQNNINIFAKATDLEYKDNRKSIPDFLKDNIPLYSTVKFDLDFENDRSIDFKKSDFKNTDAISEFISNSNTTIEADLRGNHNFYVILGDSMDLTITKSDLNWEDGEDSMCIYLYNLDDELIYENMISGDGIDVKNTFQSRKNIIKKRFVTQLGEPNIYKLIFENCDTTKNWRKDWVIDSLEINTNKIITSGSILSIKPVNFFTKVADIKLISFHIWRNDSIQDISIKNDIEEKIISLTRDDFGQSRFVELNIGKYNIDTFGHQYLRGANFAFEESQFFHPYIYDFESLGDVNFFITKYDYDILDDNWVKVSYIFDKGEIRRLQDLSEIVFLFRNTLFNKHREFINKLEDKGFSKKEELDEYIIYGKNDLFYTEENSNFNNLILNSFPLYSKVYMDKNIPEINQYGFINKSKPVGFSKSVYEVDNIVLRGDHSFYIYLEDNLHLEIEKEDLNWYEGRDDVYVRLYSLEDRINAICSTLILNDGNSTDDMKRSKVHGELICANLESGPYLLTLESHTANPRSDDFVITNIRLNTNKIMVKDKILNKKAIDLYVNSKYLDNNITFYHWRSDSNQNVIINDDILKFTDENRSESIEYILEESINKINLEKGHITIRGENFLFKPENYFDIYSIYLAEDYQEADFVILENTYPFTIYFKKIILDIL